MPNGEYEKSFPLDDCPTKCDLETERQAPTNGSETEQPSRTHATSAAVGVNIDEENWRALAACRGPQAAVFYPPQHFERKYAKEERERRAKEICASCAVRAECLEVALINDEDFGIWGGRNEKERKALRRRWLARKNGEAL